MIIRETKSSSAANEYTAHVGGSTAALWDGWQPTRRRSLGAAFAAAMVLLYPLNAKSQSDPPLSVVGASLSKVAWHGGQSRGGARIKASAEVEAIRATDTPDAVFLTEQARQDRVTRICIGCN